MDVMNVMEYKCPCCGAGLSFGEKEQKLKCESCGNSFEVDAVKAFNEPKPENSGFCWEKEQQQQMSEDEAQTLRRIVCPACGGEIIADDQTTATFCPYCDSPAVISGRVSGALRPDGVVPFRVTKEEAKTAFKSLCKKKMLLPRGFHSQQRLEKIAGIYVPYWLYDCDCDANARFDATRTSVWSSGDYRYTRTDHYLLMRNGSMGFDGIPMDGSAKMNDELMESIEPYDYSQMMDFNSAYLSGFLADKYDVEAEAGQERIEQRIRKSAEDLLRETCMGYDTVMTTQFQVSTKHAKSRYVLLPVWMLYSKYKDKTYVFAMNGQSGKITGTFPICPARVAEWFAGIAAVVTLAATLFQMLW